MDIIDIDLSKSHQEKLEPEIFLSTFEITENEKTDAISN